MEKKRHQALLIALVVMIGVLVLYMRGQRNFQFNMDQVNTKNDLPASAGYQEETTIDYILMENEASGELMDKPLSTSITIDMLLGKTEPGQDPNFVMIEGRYANRQGMYMHREAYDAFREMHAAASSEGIRLAIVSAMRTFGNQKRIWEDKWHGRQVLEGNIRANSIADPAERSLEILRFSSMPGTSRHHWGTDIDLNNLNNSYFESGVGKKIYDWLTANAPAFGFCQPYTPVGTGRSSGYEEEKWHWSYMPLSSQFLSAYKTSVSYEEIKGFDGWETAEQIGVIEKYVMGVGCGK